MTTDPRKKRKCGAKTTRAGGKPCDNPAGMGTDHLGFGPCKNHSGATPAVTKGAFREMVRAMGNPLQTDPAEGMLQTLAATAGHVAWLEQKVAGFKFREATNLDEDGVETEQSMTPNQLMWWRIYGEERDRMIRYAEVMIRAGLAERTVRLAEAQGEMLAQAIDRILGGLGLTEAQLQRVPDVVPNVLRGMIIDMPAIDQ